MSPDTLLLANVGTALSGLGCGHLLIGNLILGWLEGGVIALRHGSPRGRATWLMILANYFSAGVGALLLAYFDWQFDHPEGWRITVENTFAIHMLAIFVAYALTLVLEFPFVRSAAGVGVKLRPAIKTNLIVQTATYALLVALYASFSQHSIGLFGWRAAKPADFARDSSLWVYYVATDGDVWRVRTNASARERVVDVPREHRPASIAAYRRADGAGWDLLVFGRRALNERAIRVLASFSPDDAVDPNQYPYIEPASALGYAQLATRPSDRGLARVVATPPHQYHIAALQPPAAGLEVQWRPPGISIRRADGVSRELAVRTPLAFWYSRGSAILPSGQVVHQLGDQIVLLDPQHWRIGLLAIGGEFIVARESASD